MLVAMHNGGARRSCAFQPKDHSHLTKLCVPFRFNRSKISVDTGGGEAQFVIIYNRDAEKDSLKL